MRQPVVRRITTLRPMTRAAASSAYRPEDYAGSSTGPRPRPADSESGAKPHGNSVCAIGAIVNLRLALYLFENGILWWLSGLLGAMVGAVWNYGASSVLVWRSQNRQR
jgi:hypothetical protein